MRPEATWDLRGKVKIIQDYSRHHCVTKLISAVDFFLVSICYMSKFNSTSSLFGMLLLEAQSLPYQYATLSTILCKSGI